jgi:hypothetical protein
MGSIFSRAERRQARQKHYFRVFYIDVTLTLCPELLLGTKCVRGIITDRVFVGFAQQINLKFELSDTPSIEVCVIGLVILFIGVEVGPNPAFGSARRHECAGN